MEKLLVAYLFFAGPFGTTQDLLGLVDPEDYFQTRHITTAPSTMEKLAQSRPGDARSEVAQLLAIRWLGDHRIRAARQTLQQLAHPEPAEDPHGSVRAYARRALAQIEGAASGLKAAPWQSLRETLRWFPAEVTLVGAFDLSVPWARKTFPPRPLGDLVRLDRQSSEGGLSEFLDRVGDLQLRRVAFACYPSKKVHGGTAVLARVTGQGDRERLARYVAESMETPPIRDEVASDGVRVTVFANGCSSVVALVGDEDFLLASDKDAQTALQALDRMLEVRVGRSASVLRGPLETDLRGVPGDSHGLVVGQLPDEVTRELFGPDRSIRVAPQSVRLDLHVGDRVTVHFQARLRNADEAQQFREDLCHCQATLITSLRRVPPTEATAILIESLESFAIEQHGATVQGSGRVSRDVPWAIGEFLGAALTEALEALGQAVSHAIEGVAVVLGAAVLVASGIVVTFAALVVVAIGISSRASARSRRNAATEGGGP
jgi:hypothetical protein